VADAVVFLLIVVVGSVLAFGFGIVVLAPRIGRVLDRNESDSEESGDRPA
jgi:hypothetical protein